MRCHQAPWSDRTTSRSNGPASFPPGSECRPSTRPRTTTRSSASTASATAVLPTPYSSASSPTPAPPSSNTSHRRPAGTRTSGRSARWPQSPRPPRRVRLSARTGMGGSIASSATASLRWSSPGTRVPHSRSVCPPRPWPRPSHPRATATSSSGSTWSAAAARTGLPRRSSSPEVLPRGPRGSRRSSKAGRSSRST